MSARDACLDTSVVLRLLVGEPENQAKSALAALEAIAAAGGKAIVSDLVLAETYFALQYHYKVPKRAAIAALADMARADGIQCSAAARSVLSQPGLHAAKPGLVDRLIHAQYQETGAPMLTFEKAAKKLADARVL